MKRKFLLIILLTSFVIFANEFNIGDIITPFSDNDENGQLWSLQDNLAQKYLVVYFYPAALTAD